jgi:hypothetical protein
LRVMARVVSVMLTWRCLAILNLLMTLPTFTPIWSAPVSRPAATEARIGAWHGVGGSQQIAACAGAFGGQ